ncbi:MAG: hypothetical protein ACFFDT_06325 [Candidatus Hodarchaeota archaeon]
MSYKKGKKFEGEELGEIGTFEKNTGILLIIFPHPLQSRWAM